MINTRFKNANEAYEFLLDQTIQHGEDFDDTKALFNCGFYIEESTRNHITNKERKWSLRSTQKLNGNGIYQVILALTS